MPEYIEREAFLDYMKGTSRYFNVKFDIENFPAADAVPVVRCKDCEFYRRTEEIHPGFGTCDFVEMVRQDNDFCSKGEKRVNMTGICKWCEGEVCTNADCPIAADYCPVPDTPDVCKHESRYGLENTP